MDNSTSIKSPSVTQGRDQDPLAGFSHLDDFQTRHSDKFSKSQIKWLARFRETNGLSEFGAIVQVSRKLYIHEAKFAEWFANQRG